MRAKKWKWLVVLGIALLTSSACVISLALMVDDINHHGLDFDYGWWAYALLALLMGLDATRGWITFFVMSRR
jgi:hypothetical protein